MTRMVRTAVWLLLGLFAATGPSVRAQEAAAGLRQLVDAGQYAAAREACRQRLAQDPDDPEALYWAGRLADDGASARGRFERLLTAHPDHPLADDARLEMAELTFAGPFGLYTRARGLYLALLARRPNGPHAALALCRVGQTYLAAEEPDSARMYFNRSLAQDPHSAAAPLALAGLVAADLAAGDSSVAAGRLANLRGEGPGALYQELSRRANVPASAAQRGPVAPKVWIQVGAFGVADNATALVARLKALGVAAEAVAVPARGLHLVFAGPFPDRGSAERAQGLIFKETGETGRILNRQ